MSETHDGPEITLYGEELTHARLSELAKLADAAKPFYDWVAGEAACVYGSHISLDTFLMTASFGEILTLIEQCKNPLLSTEPPPALFDGAGRQYAHRIAVYYFFAWLVRDAPQQRLRPIIARVSKSAPDRARAESEVLATLIVEYREQLKGFSWQAVREVILDRLEGSRRALKGRAAEAVLRTAVSAALQRGYERLGGYGRFAQIEVPNREVKIGSETFDVTVDLLDEIGQVIERILIPVKTRETEGGGHSNLFTRDIETAIAAVRAAGSPIWIAVYIVAQSWSPTQTAHVEELCDFVIALPINPTQLVTLDDASQARLDDFILGVLTGRRVRKLR